MKKLTVVVLALLWMPTSGFAESSARDADIDLKMSMGGGFAPATGSQALPVAASSGGPQKFIDPYLPAAFQLGNVILGQTDGKARVYEIKGKVMRSIAGNPIEKKLKKGADIKPGDVIRTESKSSVSITFDENFQNAVLIPENSQALIVSIEPTEIKVENGSVYSAVDGLPQGSTWKISTPVAVAAVRGTLYLVTFASADGQFYAATVNIADDGKISSIDITPVDGTGSASVPEGNEITLTEGQVVDSSLVTDLDPSTIQDILNWFEELMLLRDENGNLIAPPTSGSLTDPNTIDPAGPGVPGGPTDPLDPLDTGVTPEDPMSPEEPESGDTHPEIEDCYPKCEYDERRFNFVKINEN